MPTTWPWSVITVGDFKTWRTYAIRWEGVLNFTISCPRPDKLLRLELPQEQ